MNPYRCRVSVKIGRGWSTVWVPIATSKRTDLFNDKDIAAAERISARFPMIKFTFDEWPEPRRFD